MKTIATCLIILICTIGSAYSQSKSFVTLREKFSGDHNVFSFHTSGFFARMILGFAGEHEFQHAVKDIRDIRLIVIPKEAFREHDVTLNGFKKLAKKDSFQQLAHVHDHGDDVTLLMQPNAKGGDDRYLVLVDDDNEVVAIEVTGYIDPKIMLRNSKDTAYNQY